MYMQAQPLDCRIYSHITPGLVPIFSICFECNFLNNNEIIVNHQLRSRHYSPDRKCYQWINTLSGSAVVIRVIPFIQSPSILSLLDTESIPLKGSEYIT